MNEKSLEAHNVSDTTLDRMLHPDEARDIVLRFAKPLAPENVALEDAGERVLARALVADVDLPPFRASTMDGYAVIHSDSMESREVLGSGFAGTESGLVVQSGTASKIMTGAPVPEGATAVVMVENTRSESSSVAILQHHVAEGENIRPVGADMRAGDELVAGGSILGPAEIGLLASLGHDTVLVGRRPRVAIMSTGDELVAPGETPGPGQIRDSNRFSLAVAARRAGAAVVLNRHVVDTEPELRKAFTEALKVADVIITSGGVSMGDRDLVKGLLGDLAEVRFRRVFMKPGKPLNFATIGDQLLFGLPGNPVSCLVSFQMFVRPALLVMQSAPAEVLPTVDVEITHDIDSTDRIEFQRAVVWAGLDGRLMARNTGSQMSARLASFIGSNAFLIVHPSETTFRPGDRLSALMIAPPYGNEPAR
jgi:molybdenum cofactor synthesis domain-containing protein